MSALGDGEGRTIVSLSERYGVGDADALRGQHFTSYQDGLAAAAARLGHRFEVVALTDSGERGTDGLLRLVRARLGRGPVDLVVVYEGRVAHLEPFARLAADHPDVRVLLNLFKSERHLDTPRSRGTRRTDRETLRAARDGSLERIVARFAAVGPPDNLIVTAETERRALLARSMGLEVGGVWPVHSQLAGFPSADARPVAATPAVLLQLQAFRTEPATLREVAEIVSRVVRHAADGPIPTFDVVGRFAGQPSLRRGLRRLERLGVRVADGALDDADYLALHDAHDAVWLPVRGAYNVQSSGKALDALVRGLPVLAPAGSYGAIEQSRWVPGAPSYGATVEAVELLLRLPALLATWRGELARRLPEVRRAYGPVTSIVRLLELARLAGPDAPRGGDPVDEPTEVREPHA